MYLGVSRMCEIDIMDNNDNDDAPFALSMRTKSKSYKYLYALHRHSTVQLVCVLGSCRAGIFVTIIPL